MNIIESTIEKLKDPFGILSGDRYEIFLTLEIDEEDELYSEHGISLMLIYAIENEQEKISQYDFNEITTRRFLDFALEEEEVKEIEHYCHQLVENNQF